jgi:hypothetical protein
LDDKPVNLVVQIASVTGVQQQENSRVVKQLKKVELKLGLKCEIKLGQKIEKDNMSNNPHPHHQNLVA